jgi:hypothetical protein
MDSVIAGISRMNQIGSQVGVHVEADGRGYKIIRTETGSVLYDRLPTLIRVRTLIHQIAPYRVR